MLMMGCGMPLPMGNLWGLGAIAGNTANQIQQQQLQEEQQHRAREGTQHQRAEPEVQRLVAEGQHLAELERQRELAAQEQVRRDEERKQRDALVMADQQASEEKEEKARREEDSQALHRARVAEEEKQELMAALEAERGKREAAERRAALANRQVREAKKAAVTPGLAATATMPPAATQSVAASSAPSGPPPPAPISGDIEAKKGHMIIGCRNLIKESLHAPDDAEFPGIIFDSVPRPSVDGHGNMRWHAWVKAPNLYNVKLKKWFSCIYTAKNDTIRARFED